MIEFESFDKKKHKTTDMCLICNKSTRGVGGVVAIVPYSNTYDALLYCNRCVRSLAEAQRP